MDIVKTNYPQDANIGKSRSTDKGAGLMFRMQLMRGTQQCPPLPRDSTDKGESFSCGKTEGFENGLWLRV